MEPSVTKTPEDVLVKEISALGGEAKKADLADAGMFLVCNNVLSQKTSWERI